MQASKCSVESHRALRNSPINVYVTAKYCQLENLTQSMVSRVARIAHMTDCSLLRPQPPRAGTGVCHESHCNGHIATAWPWPQACKSTYPREHSKNSEFISQEPAKGQSWRQAFLWHVQFEHSGSAELTLLCIVYLSQIAETKDEEKDTLKGMTVKIRASNQKPDAQRQWNNIFSAKKD